ncbi:MAG TPA: DegV family protein [Anaerolineae bacterium]|nr:DegV family protein [Anaerolineae bacterium]
MNRVAIVTESSSNLPPEVVEEYGIHVLPLKVIWEEKVFRDGVDLSPQEFYSRLRMDHYMPTTAAFSPSEFLETFRSLAQEHEAIVAILLSQDLTGSVEAAQIASQMAPTLPVHIVDSRTAAMAQGFIVLEAARAAAAGATAGQVVARAQEMIPRVQFLATLETLEYLRRGGRIGTAAAFLGSMLQMKPIVGIPPAHGTVVGVARPRTWKRAVEQMLDLMGEAVGERPVHVAVSHGDQEEEAHALAEELRRRFDVRELYITYFTAVMGAHAGPALCVAFYADEEKP